MASYETELDRARVPTDAISSYRSENPSSFSPQPPPSAYARRLSTSHNDGLPSPMMEKLFSSDKAGSALDKRTEDLLTADGGNHALCPKRSIVLIEIRASGRLPGGLARKGGDTEMGIPADVAN